MYGFTRCATRNNNIKNTTPTNNIITNDRRTDRPQSYQSAERYDSTNTITEDDGMVEEPPHQALQRKMCSRFTELIIRANTQIVENHEEEIIIK